MTRLLSATMLMLALGATSFGAVELQLTSGASTTVIGSGGAVQFTGVVGGWTVNLTSGLSGGPTSLSMDLSSIDAVSSAGAAPLTILLSDNFTVPGASSFTLGATGHLVTGTGTSTYSLYYDNGNTLFATTTLVGTLGPFSGAYNAGGTFGASAVGPFSLTEAVTLTSTSANTQWSTDSSNTGVAVPEPASVVLLGGVLLFTTGAIRRKMRRA